VLKECESFARARRESESIEEGNRPKPPRDILPAQKRRKDRVSFFYCVWLVFQMFFVVLSNMFLKEKRSKVSEVA